ncbi:MAG: methyl-accepting chemotaxis protein [Legionella sp.]
MDTMTPKQGFIFSIRTRLIIGFMTFCLPLLMLIMLLLPKINDVMQLNRIISLENLPQILDSQIYQAQDIIENWIMTGDSKEKEYFAIKWERIDKTRNQWNQIINSGVLQNEKLQTSWNQLQQLYEPLYEIQSSLINAPRDEKPDNLENSRIKTRAIIKSMIDIIDGQYSPEEKKRIGGLSNYLLAEIDQNTQKIYQCLDYLKKSAYGLLFLALILTLVVPYVTQKSILGAVDHVIDIAKLIAAGERNVPILLSSTGRLGRLFISIQTMQEAIAANDEALRIKEKETRELYEQLVESSNKFSEYSSKVAAGDLRERLKLDNKDLLHGLGHDLNSMTDWLSLITRNITKASSDIVTMVKTVITSADQQALSVTSQAAAINEISA